MRRMQMRKILIASTVSRQFYLFELRQAFGCSKQLIGLTGNSEIVRE